jgi:PLP dependent protein
MDTKQRLQAVQDKINQAAQKYHRESASVTLLAVSKKQPIDKIREAIDGGQKHFGENYLQEALVKIQELSGKDIVWHFIGPIQSNKTKLIAENFAWVESVDRLKIAKRLNEQRPEGLPPLNVCIEVNLSDEDSKSGVSLNEILPLAKEIIKMPRLKLRGLMSIPAFHDDFEKQRGVFKELAEALKMLNNEGLQLDTLSVGMSDDFEAAIAEGSTIVRIGTAIFGPREN